MTRVMEGASPAEQLAIMDSEVHHIEDGLREHRIETRERFAGVETRIGNLSKDMEAVARELHGLNKTIKLIGGIVSPVLLILLTAVITKVFGG